MLPDRHSEGWQQERPYVPMQGAGPGYQGAPQAAGSYQTDLTEPCPSGRRAAPSHIVQTESSCMGEVMEDGPAFPTQGLPPTSVPLNAQRGRGHGHQNLGGGTQNQGNILGDRSCVRQSKLYRQHESGNTMKELMGHDTLAWKVDSKEGAYAGHAVYDHDTDRYTVDNSYTGVPMNGDLSNARTCGAPTGHLDASRRKDAHSPARVTAPSTPSSQAWTTRQKMACSNTRPW